MAPSLFTRFTGRWCDDCRLAIQLQESSARCPSCGGSMRPANVTVEPTDVHGSGPDDDYRYRMDALRIHLKDVHCNEAALKLIDSEALDQHNHEHHGPGGLRNHDQPEQLHDWTAFGGVRDPERGAT